MAISQKRYIDITSGVGGQAAATERELIARLMTTNILAPFGSVMEFTSLDNVGRHFGTTSKEYAFAEKYFGFISKDIAQAKKISFARYAPEGLAPALVSTIVPNAVATFSAVTSGTLTVTLGGVSQTFDAIDLSAVTTLDGVASAIQSEIRGYSTGGALWTSATVTYAVNAYTGLGQFVLQGGEVGAASIAYAEGDVASLLGWDIASLPVVSQGAVAETPAGAMARIADISNNFGSFSFIEDLTTDEIAAVAAWCNTANIQFMYSVAVSPSNYSTIAAAVNGMNGTMLTLDAGDTYAEYMPMALLATTNYDRTNASRNYMFQQFPGVTPTVSTDALADVYDNAKVNYYGATQSAGKQLAFYQRGVMMGSVEDAGVYCNEMWLKDAMIVAFFNLLLAVNKVPANQDGLDMTRGVMMDVINRAINNGTILKLKSLTPTQKAYIYSLTNDPDAWVDVYNNGFKLNMSVTSDIENGTTRYAIDYILIYAKGDSIKKVNGTHVLI